MERWGKRLFMMENLNFEDNVFFNEKLREVLPYQIKSYDAVFPLTRKEFEEIKSVYQDVAFSLNVYDNKVENSELIKQITHEREERLFFDNIGLFGYPDYCFASFEDFMIKASSNCEGLVHRWFFPVTPEKALSFNGVAKLKMLSESEFKSLVLELLKNIGINLNEKQIQFLLYFLELEVFYGSEDKRSWDSFKLFSSEKSNNLTNIEKKAPSFNYHDMAQTSEFKKIYLDRRYEIYHDALNGSLDIILDLIECVPFGEFLSTFLSNRIEKRLWNQCKEEYPELYDIHQLHEITHFVVEYYDNVKNYLLKMFKTIEQMGKKFPEMNQTEQYLDKFRLEHFTIVSNRSLFYINQKFVNEKSNKFNDFITKQNSKSELNKLFILYKSYRKFINDPQCSKAQSAYLEKYFEPLYNDLLKNSDLIMKQELEKMLNFYMNEIKKFTLNSNSITGIKLENHFEILKKNLLTLDTKEQLQLYFSGKEIKNEELLTLTEWFDLAEKMIRKYNIEDKEEYKKYILKPQKRGIK